MRIGIILLALLSVCFGQYTYKYWTDNECAGNPAGEINAISSGVCIAGSGGSIMLTVNGNSASFCTYSDSACSVEAACTSTTLGDCAVLGSLSFMVTGTSSTSTGTTTGQTTGQTTSSSSGYDFAYWTNTNCAGSSAGEIDGISSGVCVPGSGGSFILMANGNSVSLCTFTDNACTTGEVCSNSALGDCFVAGSFSFMITNPSSTSTGTTTGQTTSPNIHAITITVYQNPGCTDAVSSITTPLNTCTNNKGGSGRVTASSSTEFTVCIWPEENCPGNTLICLSGSLGQCLTSQGYAITLTNAVALASPMAALLLFCLVAALL